MDHLFIGGEGTLVSTPSTNESIGHHHWVLHSLSSHSKTEASVPSLFWFLLKCPLKHLPYKVGSRRLLKCPWVYGLSLVSIQSRLLQAWEPSPKGRWTPSQVLSVSWDVFKRFKWWSRYWLAHGSSRIDGWPLRWRYCLWEWELSSYNMEAQRRYLHGHCESRAGKSCKMISYLDDKVRHQSWFLILQRDNRAHSGLDWHSGSHDWARPHRRWKPPP